MELVKSAAAVLVASLLVLACAPHWYQGSGAILTESSELEIVLRQRDWGDCYRILGTFPTVYRLSRPGYTLSVSHGQRYWPEFFLEATSDKGEPLSLAGPMISLLESPDGGDISRLRTARGTSPTHRTTKLRDMDEPAIEVEVLDGEQRVIAREKLTFRLENAQCFGWDTI